MARERIAQNTVFFSSSLYYELITFVFFDTKNKTCTDVIEEKKKKVTYSSQRRFLNNKKKKKMKNSIYQLDENKNIPYCTRFFFFFFKKICLIEGDRLENPARGMRIKIEIFLLIIMKICHRISMMLQWS